MAVVSVSNAKRQFSNLLKRAAYSGETIVIGSRGRPEAALISVTELSRLRAAELEHDARQLEEAVRTSTSIKGLGELLSPVGVAEQQARYETRSAGRASAVRKGRRARR